MLPAGQRLRRSADFAEVVRRGRRGSKSLLTVHLLPASAPVSGPAASGPAFPGAAVPGAAVPGAAAERPPAVVQSRAGLVVSKAVGGSVVRHRTARRLRHLLRDRIAGLPPGSRLVVRAAAAAGAADSAQLAADLDRALATVLRPKPRPGRGATGSGSTR